MGYAVSIDKSYFFMYKYGMINRITTVHVDQVSKLISPLSAPRDRPTKVGFLRVQLRSPMPKRLHPARVSAAVAAGDPPASAQYAHDDAWHDAQNIWLAKWSVRLLPEGPQRRRQWTKRKEEHARLVAASSKVAALTKKRVYARGKPKPPVVHEAVLAGPPRDKRPLPLSQPAYELAMGKYAIATQLYLDRVTILI